jgi:cytochrome P450
MLRYFTIVDSAVGGVPVRAGEGVLTLGLVANRDPDAFLDPDAVDVERPARHHVAFGFGPHQ